MPLRIKLLGALQVTNESGDSSELIKWSKGCALVAYLVTTGQPQSREALADLLWDAASTAQSLQNLRKLLSRMRQWVPGLVVTRKRVAYEVETAVSVDLHILTTTLAAGSTPEIDEALRLYEGDLLDGFYLNDAPRFNEWLLLEREQLRQRVVAAYRQVCFAYAEQKAWSKGVDAARRWLSLDEFDEDALRHFMEMLAADGLVETALRQYSLSRQRLWQEFGVEPERATLALVQQLTQLKEKSGSPFSWDVIESAQSGWPEPGKLAEPGPLPTLSTMPYQRNVDFTGRRESLLFLAGHLLPRPDGGESFTRTVAITGMGGLGKTQLAVEFCYRYGRYFPGGVFWLGFADPENVVSEVVAIGGERGMGLYRDADNLTLTDRVGRIRKAWQEPIPRLLIFDNCEDEGLLAQWAPVTGGCRVLLTSLRANWSRELQVVERPLPVLDPSESIDFLCRLAPVLNREEAAEVAAELGHLPLALHLAGGFLDRYQQVSAAGYLSQLREEGLVRHPSLKGRGAQYSPTGHALNVSRTLTISLGELDAADEINEMAWQLLARAACFAPEEPIPQELLLATAVSSGDDLMANLLAEDGLRRLITLGFLQKEGVQAVFMHRLAAAFAHEVSGHRNEEAFAAVTTLLVKVLSTRLEQTGHLGHLPFASVHLRHLTNRALATKDPITVRLGTLLGRHLRDVADYKGARVILERVLAIPNLTNDTEALANTWIGLARVQRSMGKDEESLTSAEQAERLLRTADSPSPAMLTHVLHRKGWSLYMLGRADEALAAAEEALAICKQTHSSRGMISNLNLLGEVYSHLLEQYETAVHYLNEALVIARKLANVRAEAALLSNLGEIVERQGDFDKAFQLFQEAMAISTETGNKDKEIVYCANLGRVQVLLGRYDQAVTCLVELIDVLPPESHLLAEVYLALAEAYLGQGQLELAAAVGQQALAQAKANKKQVEIGWAWVLLGRLAARQDTSRPPNQSDKTVYDAPACFQAGLTIFTQMNLKRERALTLWHWAQYELQQGDLESGRLRWQEAKDIFTYLDLPLLAARMGSRPSW
ncbi:MAG: tetratricopeptide repeat protein [Ardenticatenaceae bacterium]|nr:tetratricopeptide repeat protein [Ardenticatenaceae bacterium]